MTNYDDVLFEMRPGIRARQRAVALRWILFGCIAFWTACGVAGFYLL